MRKVISLVLACSVFFVGCAGREANPIAVYLPGDENRSCTALKAEVAQLQVDMQRLLPKTDKGLSNALWATAGVFLIVPFFFMDFKDAERIEFEAMRQRHNRLLIYAAEKNCDFGEVRDERIQSFEERKAAAIKAKKEAETAQEAQDTKVLSKKEYEDYQRYLAEKDENKSQESSTENQ